MAVIPLLRPEQHWICPNCTLTDVTYRSEPHTQFHACKGLRGFTAPMVPEGIKCKIEAIEREAYIADDMPQYDGEGRPISTVVTTRDDGTDCAAYAGCATLDLRKEL
jgi:hypothetical protein